MLNLGSITMRCAINLYDNAKFVVDEINDVRPNRNLPVKLQTTQAAIPQRPPELAFSSSGCPAHALGLGIGERCWFHASYAI